MKYFSIFLLAVLNFKPAFSNLDIPIDKKTIVRLFESGTPITDKNIHKIRTGTIFECKRIHYKRFAIYGHFYPYYYYKFLNTDIGFIVMSKEVLWNPSKRLNTDFFLKKILSEVVTEDDGVEEYGKISQQTGERKYEIRLRMRKDGAIIIRRIYGDPSSNTPHYDAFDYCPEAARSAFWGSFQGNDDFFNEP